jgi:hypothetical protein
MTNMNKCYSSCMYHKYQNINTIYNTSMHNISIILLFSDQYFTETKISAAKRMLLWLTIDGVLGYHGVRRKSWADFLSAHATALHIHSNWAYPRCIIHDILAITTGNSMRLHALQVRTRTIIIMSKIPF